MVVSYRHPDDYDRLTPLFDRLADPATPEAGKRQARAALVTGHLPVAEHIARKFARRGEPADDLEQVARVGLIQAVDRFDPARGHHFLAFAVPTIMGEIRRYFRDRCWPLTVPRSLQERHAAITAAANELAQECGHAPRPRDIAERLGMTLDEVYDGLQAGMAYQCDPLPGPAADGDRPAADPLAVLDQRLTLVEDRQALSTALTVLSERDLTVVLLRFYGNLSQTQIAQRVGLSQMQVSRILAASLARLREELVDGEEGQDEKTGVRR
jgi:RNA polymerase sigma-B factor